MGTTDRILSVGTAFSVCIILLSIYLRDPANELQRRLESVVNGLIEVEDQHVNLSPKVAVGYGACVDLYVEGKDFLPYNQKAEYPQHFDDINTMEELYRSYAYYFQHGAAAERFMSNSSLFDELVMKGESAKGSRYSLGGNAPVMASRLHDEGCQVLLASTLTPLQRKALPKHIRLVGPNINRDDIHLIIEYKAGEKWGPYVSPRSNRYIIHNDVHNPHVSTFEDFRKHIKNFNPDLLVISGLQLMDNYPFAPGVRESKLRAIKEQMVSVKRRTKVHFEMASFTEHRLLIDLKETIIPYADSLGMNEQELANLYSLYKFGNVTRVSDSTPRVATVLDQMRQVFNLIRESSRRIFGSRKLSRIHVHTLAYQTVLTGSDSFWKNSNIAAAKASLTAYRHVCASSKVDLDKAAVLLDESFSMSVMETGRGRVEFEAERPISCWEENSTVLLCLAPGLVCTEAAQTAGGGDNVSAAALAVQL